MLTFGKRNKGMDYQKFKQDYESSGLTQRAYGQQISMSSSMVNYYLRRARELSTTEIENRFQELSVEQLPSDNRQIKIITPDGIEIAIPL